MKKKKIYSRPETKVFRCFWGSILAGSNLPVKSGYSDSPQLAKPVFWNTEDDVAACADVKSYPACLWDE